MLLRASSVACVLQVPLVAFHPPPQIISSMRSPLLKGRALAVARSEHRKRLVATILLAVVVTHKLDTDRHARDGQAGTYIMETELWQPGFRVVGRKGNKKRKRMLWRDRLEQIGSESEFRARYKIPSRLFTEICGKIRCEVEAENTLQAARSSGGLITVKLRLSMALRYMAGGHYYDIADLHGVSPEEVHKSVRLVARAISKHYSTKLRFPYKDQEALQDLSDGFFKAGGETLPGCVGCVDGIVIPIEKPRWGEITNIKDMWNRKGYYAKVVQAMCDHNLKFMWMSAKCSGNTNDALAWDCTELHKTLQSGVLSEQFWIAGDDAYKGSGTVVTPFPGCGLPQAERAFNFYHSRTRMHIERAFGVWKERWGMFHRPSCLSLRTLNDVIKCTMILHNMCIDYNVTNTTFTGTIRETSDAWPGDDPEVIFNDMTPAEMINIIDMPYACREWLKNMLADTRVVAPDPV